MMRLKLINFGRNCGDDAYAPSPRSDRRWTICMGCCHVRCATIFLGVWHLSLHLLSLAAIAILILHPQTTHPKSGLPTGNGVSFVENDVDQDLLAVLPTPLSTEIHQEPQALPVSDLIPESANKPALNKKNPDSSSKLLYGSIVYKDWFGEPGDSSDHHISYEDLNISIGVNFCTLGITILMIYGAVRGKSIYLMPFFCLQAFDFFVTSLSVIGYLSYVPDIRQVLIKNPNIPLREELLAMEPQCLSLLILAGILVTLVAKVYFISIVWNCYKFLSFMADAVERDFCISGIVDGQNLLEIPSPAGSDLPDYATAMTDPRFAKKPMYSVPPPPYTAVVNIQEVEIATASETAETEASGVTQTNPTPSSQENGKP